MSEPTVTVTLRTVTWRLTVADATPVECRSATGRSRTISPTRVDVTYGDPLLRLLGPMVAPDGRETAARFEGFVETLAAPAWLRDLIETAVL